MLEGSSGKLLVYASSFASRDKRLKSINDAAEMMGKLLNLNVEVVRLRKKFKPIYVYYKGGEAEPVPIYYNNDKYSDLNQVYKALRNMMFVLSFHPKYSALRSLRKEIIQFS